MISRTTSTSSFNWDDEEHDGQAEVIAYGVASTISLVHEDQVIIKTATTNRKFAKEPHDIRKEVRILGMLDHPNIISLLAFHDDDASHTLQLHVPYVSLSLETILDQPHFTPSDNKYFQTVSRAIMYQVLLGVSYLHSAPHRIAHRDLKPSNVLITLSGCIQLIDFGVSYDPNPDPQDIWHEDERRMYFEVSTGPYRAPELLFGTRSYNPYATDMWSLGCLFSDFFTPLVTEEEEEGYSDYPSEGGPSLTRKTLFDAGRGEIALIWSIFKTMGTPTTVTWPGFNGLPDAKRLAFNVVPAVPLQGLLPNATDDAEVDLIYALLKYPPSARLSAENALAHACFSADLLVPPELTSPRSHSQSYIYQTADNKTLGDLLEELLEHE